MKNNKLMIVVPCYNEKEVLTYTISELQILLDIMTEDGLISGDSGVCFVNDGSSDKTQEIIENICQRDKMATRFNSFGFNASYYER